MNVAYDIHGLLTIQIEGSRPNLLPGIAYKYDYFRCDHIANPDIQIRIGPFRPAGDLGFNVNHKFFMERNRIYWRDSDKGLRWAVQIEGLEEERTTVWYHPSPRNYGRFPWFLFPELVLYLYVLQPLIEARLNLKENFLIHSAGFSREGKAYLVAGRGGAHKTTLALTAVRRGYALLGDDMVILCGDQVRSCPTMLPWFDYYLRAQRPDERLFLRDKVGLFMHLLRRLKPAVAVADMAYLHRAWLVLNKRGDRQSMPRPLNPSAAVQMFLTNQDLESRTYVSHKYLVGNFLQAYNYVFPSNPFAACRHRLAQQLAQTLSSVPCEVIEVDDGWHRSDDLARCLENV
jgi:hypothetical protein